MWTVKTEQVRKGGLPPLSQQRGQAALPDLFYLTSLNFHPGYGLAPLGLSWNASGSKATPPIPAIIATVAAVPNPKSPPPPVLGAGLGVVVAPGPKQCRNTPPAAGSVLPSEPCSVAISPFVFFFAVSTAQP